MSGALHLLGSRSEAPPYRIKMNGRHLEGVNDSEMRLDIDLTWVHVIIVLGHLESVWLRRTPYAKLQSLISLLQPRQGNKRRGVYHEL